MQKRLFLCSPEPRAAGTVESPERREGPGRGGKLDRRLSETGESTARIAPSSDGAQRLRKWLGRWRLGVGPGIGARSIGGDLRNPGGGCRANLSQSLHQPIRRFPPLLPLLPLRTIVTLVSFVTWMNSDRKSSRLRSLRAATGGGSEPPNFRMQIAECVPARASRPCGAFSGHDLTTRKTSVPPAESRRPRAWHAKPPARRIFCSPRRRG